MSVTASSTLHAPVGQAGAAADLREQYDSYRLRQATALAHMLPREAVRPLYRRALRDGGLDRVREDPLGLLVEFCERLLPLPPFEVWLQDVTLNPEAHLDALDDGAGAPTAQAPATIESRSFDVGGEQWTAHLRSFRDGVVWRGFIAFEQRRTGRVLSTALVFRESDPSEVRDRFLSFEPVALEAFLRSART